MCKFFDSGYGYVEFNPDLSNSYDMETEEEIYVPSNYPFDIPKVYLEGHCEYEYDCRDKESIIIVRNNILTQYTHHSYNDKEYDVEEFHLDTLEKKAFKVTLESTSPISIDELTSLVDYIDPNIIKKFNSRKIAPPSN